MRIIYPPVHIKHNPRYEIFNGEQTSHQEIPERLKTIIKALTKNGFKLDKVSKKIPLSLLKKVHTPDYVDFIKKSSSALKENECLYPAVFGEKNKINGELNSLARLGIYSLDMYTPILKHTYNAALQSASVAYEVAHDIKEGKIKIGYALCRPPGHHAERSRMGGYCYFNNTAVAAEFLSQFGKVAILDVDFHHGNGTQDIFYDRKDVLTVSIHANPVWKFPYYSGFTNEKGVDKGKGLNINYSLDKGTTNNQYQYVLKKALTKIIKHHPKYLVISYGADTHESDPIGGFLLTTDYYTEMAKAIRALELPTVIIQEGGYNNVFLGKNVLAFLNGFI